MYILLKMVFLFIVMLRWSLFRGILFIFRAVAMKHLTRAPGCLGYIGDEILSSYMGIIINHYIQGSLLKNSVMEVRGFFRGSFGCLQFLLFKVCISHSSMYLKYPDGQCMRYFPTFLVNINQM